ncbi:MAG: hypothetical protein HC819_23280 [Cyclobacteriaceae bacterium]|nr:hypothetical protein [Cyclobacteriaceae bacterium]
MNKKKIFKIAGITAIAGILIGASVFLYMFFMPHRDVQATKTDFTLTSSEIVMEYLTDNNTANEKYLAEDGESKVLEVSGMVSKISEDFNGQKVILLKYPQDKAGVSATFTPQTNNNLKGVVVGQNITVKGVIRAGASYDEDLELYENVILDKSDLIKIN